MAFNATFTIEDKVFRVLSFDYQAMRDKDRTGRPTSVLYGANIKLVIEHSPDCILLHHWAYTNHEMKSGKITFMQRDNFQKLTEVRFSDGYIFSIGTSFKESGDQPMIEELTICAGKFEYESKGNMTMVDLEWPS